MCKYTLFVLILNKIFTNFYHTLVFSLLLCDKDLSMNTLYTQTFETPLGPMVGFASLEALLMLDFKDSRFYDRHLEEISFGFGVIKNSKNKTGNI